MSSAVARPMRSSSKKLTSSTVPSLYGFAKERGEGQRRRYDDGGPPSYRLALLDLFDGAGLAAAQVDAELLRGAEHVLVGVAHLDGHAVRGQHLHVEAERLHFLDEHLEGLGNARLGDVLALDDRLVDLHAAGHVVGLDRQEFLERVSGAVCLKRPHLHLTEALTTELRLTTQRLLRDHRVRTGRTGVELVVDQVVQLEDVHVPDRDRVRERLAGAAVE